MCICILSIYIYVFASQARMYVNHIHAMFKGARKGNPIPGTGVMIVGAAV